MEVKIKKTDVTLTPDVENYLSKKLETLGKFVDPEDTTTLCAVEVGKTTERHQTGDIFFCEINLTVSGKQFRATATDVTLMAAIDRAKDELMLELGRSKGKERTLSRRAGAAVKAMQKGVDFVTDLPERSVKLVKWGRKEFRGYWPFRQSDE